MSFLQECFVKKFSKTGITYTGNDIIFCQQAHFYVTSMLLIAKAAAFTYL